MGSVSWMRGRPKLAGCTTAKAGIVTDRQTALHRDLAADQAFLVAQCLKVRLDAAHVSRVTLFMASDDSDGMTGQHVLVDAGIAQCSVMG